SSSREGSASDAGSPLLGGARSPTLLPVFGAERERPRAARRFLPYVNELEARPQSPQELEHRTSKLAHCRDDPAPCDDNQLDVPAQEVTDSEPSSPPPRAPPRSATGDVSRPGTAQTSPVALRCLVHLEGGAFGGRSDLRARGAE